MRSFFPHPHTLPKATTSPPGWISSCRAHLWTTTYSWGSSAGAPTTPAIHRHGIITEILISVPQNHTVLWMCMKISSDAKPVNYPGEWGGKEKQPKTCIEIDTYISPFRPAISGWCTALDTLFLNTSPPRMLLLIKKIIHPVEGICFTFTMWQCKSHIKAEKMQDQKNKT